MIVTDWPHLYGEGWQKEIVPEAFSHPAKFSRALIRHIYDHCVVEGWLSEGDTVIDPFGGVALGGLDAMRLGAHWIGVELEAKFVALGAQNIALWNSRYAGRFAKWGTARLLQGDSRYLLEVVQGAGIAVTSPPFAEITPTAGDPNYSWKFHGDQSQYGSTPGNLGNLRADDKGFAAALSSPPFLQTSGGTNVTSDSGPLSDPRLIERHAAGNAAAGYGDDAASLSKMPEGDAPSIAVSSPPYSESMERKGRIDPEKSKHIGGPHSQMNRSDTRYGETDGQIGSMPEGDLNNIAQVVSSPPYEANDQRGGHTAVAEQKHVATQGYGETEGNVGNEQGDTFWSAARLIVAQTYAVLRPGGHAVWVVKSFVRNKQIVDFPGQWRALCESVGFTTLHEHHALLTEDHGTQTAMDGNHKRHIKKRVSFFRRLAEKKGSPPIDYEVVLCMVK